MIRFRVTKDDGRTESCKFDRVIPKKATQVQTFEGLQIPLLVTRVMEGYDSTVIAYGQTNSGKTYTMEGSIDPNTLFVNESGGIVQRVIQDLFKQLESRNDPKLESTTIQCSYIQIHDETVYDLLNNSSGLRIQWDDPNQFMVENATMAKCLSLAETIRIFKDGIKNRTKLNQKYKINSSQTHTLFTLFVETTYNEESRRVIRGRLQFVDLAGSEINTQQGNQSLLTLKKVIKALSGNKSKLLGNSVPYKESKLTALLKNSLGGNSYCLMVVYDDVR